MSRAVTPQAAPGSGGAGGKGAQSAASGTASHGSGSGCTPWRAGLMALAMCFMSSAGTGFALIDGVPPLLKAAWRLWVTSAIQLPVFIYQWHKASPETRQRWRGSVHILALSGVFLGIHFGSWTWSIDHTSLAHSLLWVSSHPLVVVGGMWVGALVAKVAACQRVFGSALDRVSAPVWLETGGAIVGFLGGAVMVLDAGADDTPVTVEGDAVAFLGAVAMVVYLASGRVLREWMPLFLYALPVTFIGGVTAFLVSVGMEGATFTGSDGKALFGWLFQLDWLLLVLYQGFGPGIMGHTVVNHLLEHLSPLIVSVVLLMEPLIGSVIGFAAGRQDVPGVWTWLGGPILVVGAVMVTVGQHRRKPPAATKAEDQPDADTEATDRSNPTAEAEEGKAVELAVMPQ